MRVAVRNGYVLTYDTDDVEDLTFAVPIDVIDLTQPEDLYFTRGPGRVHLDLHIDFKDGKRPIWITDEEHPE
jgi:hypothetical protein